MYEGTWNVVPSLFVFNYHLNNIVSNEHTPLKNCQNTTNDILHIINVPELQIHIFNSINSINSNVHSIQYQ